MKNWGDRKLWLTSDAHLDHKKMTTLCGRPENFTQLYQDNWRKLISYNDIVLDLGDCCFSDPYKYYRHLPGIKILVLGSHDKKTSSYYLDSGYSFVCEGFKLDNIYFTHYPVEKLPEGCEWNIHGHLHLGNYGEFGVVEKQDFHLCFRLEHEEYQPRLLSEWFERQIQDK